VSAEVFVKVADCTVISCVTTPLMDQISHTFCQQSLAGEDVGEARSIV